MQLERGRAELLTMVIELKSQVKFRVAQETLSMVEVCTNALEIPLWRPVVTQNQINGIQDNPNRGVVTCLKN